MARRELPTGGTTQWVAFAWYIARLRKAVKANTRETEDGRGLSLSEAQIRLTSAKARIEEMNLANREVEPHSA